MQRYLVAAPLGEPESIEVMGVMRQLAEISGKPIPTLDPHFSFSRPIAGAHEGELVDAVRAAVADAFKTHVRLGGLDFFGKEYAVLPISPVRDAYLGFALLWDRMVKGLKEVVGYEEGLYEKFNTPHVSVASDLSEIFETKERELRGVVFRARNIWINQVTVYQRSALEDPWAELHTFKLRD